MAKAEYDEQALGPRRITEEDWYRIARRDRAAIVDQFGGPPVGECVGRVQDILHDARSWALLDRFMAAMQRALEADKVRDQITQASGAPMGSWPLVPRSGWARSERIWTPGLAEEARASTALDGETQSYPPPATAADDEPDLHQPQGGLADPQAFKSDPAA